MQSPPGNPHLEAVPRQGYELQFPSWHGMDRWDEGIAPGVLRPNLVGRYKESLEFQALPLPLQTQERALDLTAFRRKVHFQG